MQLPTVKIRKNIMFSKNTMLIKIKLNIKNSLAKNSFMCLVSKSGVAVVASILWFLNYLNVAHAFMVANAVMAVGMIVFQFMDVNALVRGCTHHAVLSPMGGLSSLSRPSVLCQCLISAVVVGISRKIIIDDIIIGSGHSPTNKQYTWYTVYAAYAKNLINPIQVRMYCPTVEFGVPRALRNIKWNRLTLIAFILNISSELNGTF
jgi:hypothetical protein